MPGSYLERLAFELDQALTMAANLRAIQRLPIPFPQVLPTSEQLLQAVGLERPEQPELN